MSTGPRYLCRCGVLFPSLHLYQRHALAAHGHAFGDLAYRAARLS